MSEILKWAIIFIVAIIVEMFLLAGYLDLLDKREIKSEKKKESKRQKNDGGEI